MANFTFHCPGCKAALELEILIGGSWKCAQQCIGFQHQHQIPNHPVAAAEATKHWLRNASDQTVPFDVRVRCAWSGALVAFGKEETRHD